MVTASQRGNDFCLLDLLGPNPCIPREPQEKQDCWGTRLLHEWPTPPSIRSSQRPPRMSTPSRNTYTFCPTFGTHTKKIPSKQTLFPQRHLQRTNKQPRRRSTYLGLRVQVCRISRDAELHRPRFYGNYSYRYSAQPGNTRDKSKFIFLLLHN